MIFEKKLISPHSLRKKFPLSNEDEKNLLSFRNESKKISRNESRIIAIFVGPCSIHHEESLVSYATKLFDIQDLIKDKIFLILRCHIEKPRTTNAWKGFLMDPNLDNSCDINLGLERSRKLFSLLTHLKIPISLEILNPFFIPYYEDLITWGFIGARTSSSQIHREIASKLDFPVGFKNNPEGSFLKAIQSMNFAKYSHTFPLINKDGVVSIIKSSGNRYTNLVLRGTDNKPNFDTENLFLANTILEKNQLNSNLIVDCAHGNSGKNVENQKNVFKSVTYDFIHFKTPLCGIMMESFIDSGSQNFRFDSPPNPAQSITDPCISLNDTKDLILSFYEDIKSHEKKLCVNMQTNSA
jgi:3-deoxy-7-phosphoheptulonate synthase